MAQFMVLQKNGLPVVRDCVRIAKKSLVFSEPVDGKNQVPKERCFYYCNAENSNDMKRLKKAVERGDVDEADSILKSTFKQVIIKTTHF